MPIAFVKNVASGQTSSSTTFVFTVPAAGVAAGDILVVRIMHPTVGTTISSIVDTGGNTYTELVAQADATDTSFLWRGLITVALSSGNTITVTFANKGNCCGSVDQFTGLQNVEDGENKGTGTSTSPSSGAITQTQAADLLVTGLGIVAGRLDSFTEDTDTDGGDSWHSLTSAAQTTIDNITRGAYKITTSAVSQTYNPTLGTSRTWQAQLGSLKGTADTYVPRNPGINHQNPGVL